MKQLIIVCVLVVLLVSVSVTQAGITYVDVVDATSGQPDTRFLPSGTDPFDDYYYRWYNDDWGWSHTFDPQETLEITINKATLEILAFHVDYYYEDFAEVDLIKGDDIVLGQLDGVPEDAWTLTTLTLDSAALDALLDGTMNMWIDIDAAFPGPSGPYWAVTLASSTLTIDYDVIEPESESEPEPEPELDPDPTPPPTQTIPAPGAILLGGIGVSLVGWLRRRRTL